MRVLITTPPSLGHVLSDESFRDHAQHWAEVMTTMPSPEDVAAHLETLV